MQRTWKILSESSASSADANRSSPSNSSDDSDCSTQTLHSMTTSMVASPPGTASLSSVDSSSPLSREDSPIDPTSPLTELVTTADEVQDKENAARNFFPALNKPSPPQTKSEQPNDEKDVQDKENEIRAFFSMSGENYVTTPELAKTTLQRLRQRLSGHSINNGSNSESAMRALELLRITIQSAFDKDIDVIIKRYMELYFKPAFINIKENLGENAVSDEMLQKMSCALLENAKEQYHGLRLRQSQVQVCTVPNINGNGTINEQNAPVTGSTTASIPATSRLGLKRSSPSTANKNEINGNTLPQKRAFSAVSTRTQLTSNQNQLNLTERRSTANIASQSIQIQQNLQQPAPQLQLQPQQQITSPQPLANATARRQIFWNTANISISTKFVLDVQANQAFGFGTDGRERLASKHPELIRYLPDTDDRNWLLSQNIISQQSRNTRFLFLIYDEVFNLKSHEYYRNKPNVDCSIMRTFVVPDFIIQKMRHFFVDLNIKSRGLITNSFSMGVTSTQSSANTQSPSGTQQNTNTNTSTTTTTINNTAQQSISQLRTALLHGQTSQLQASLFNEDTLMGSCGSTTNDFVTTTTLNDNTTTGSGVNSTTNLFQPTRTSTLSSSHATLTALLNNTGPTGNIGNVTTKMLGRNNDRNIGTNLRK